MPKFPTPASLYNIFIRVLCISLAIFYFYFLCERSHFGKWMQYKKCDLKSKKKKKQMKINMFTNYYRIQKSVKTLKEKITKYVQLYKDSSLPRNGNKAEDPVWFHCWKMYKIEKLVKVKCVSPLLVPVYSWREEGW